jgi:predicted Na+-dependent transporter
VIPHWLILKQLLIGVLLPLVTGVVLNRVLRSRIKQIQPWFALLGSLGLFMAVFLNVGTASPLLRHLPLTQIGWATFIVLLVNLSNFAVGSLIGRIAKLERGQQVTCEFGSGMRSNGTALVVGLASFPGSPLVTVPAAIYIIFQHLLASIVKYRLEDRDACPSATFDIGNRVQPDRRHKQRAVRDGLGLRTARRPPLLP